MSSENKFYIWEGIYEKWDDVPVIDGAFDSTKWLDSQMASVREEIANFTMGDKLFSPCAQSRDDILPTVVAMAKSKNDPIKVLDFGGGLATSFLPLLASLPSSEGLEFHVVESKGVCDKAKVDLVFPEDTKLFFHTELPAGTFDIIHAARSFQYVDDWKKLLLSFAKLRPKYLILAGVLAGDIEPFVSLQNYYGYKIRVQFLNFKELAREAEHLGLRLIYKSPHLSKRLGKEGPLPMDNFPAERRIIHPCQLLFELN